LKGVYFFELCEVKAVLLYKKAGNFLFKVLREGMKINYYPSLFFFILPTDLRFPYWLGLREQRFLL